MKVDKLQQALTKETKPYSERQINAMMRLDGNKFLVATVNVIHDCYRVVTASPRVAA